MIKNLLPVFLLISSPVFGQSLEGTPYHQGLVLLEHGKVAEGLEQLEQVPVEHNDYYEAMVVRMSYTDKLKSFEDYVSLHEEAVKNLIGVDEFEQWELELAVVDWQIGKNQNAKGLLEDILKNDPYRNDARCAFAQLLLSENKNEEAYQLLMAAPTGHHKLDGWKGVALTRQGKYKEALPLLEYATGFSGKIEPYLEYFEALIACLDKLKDKNICRVVTEAEIFMDADNKYGNIDDYPQEMEVYKKYISKLKISISQAVSKYCG